MDKDISTLLKEIKLETGWSEPRIAAELNTSQPTVNRILKGQKECKGSTFKAIVELHKRVCCQALAKINNLPTGRRKGDT